jgi:spermine/spermidine synthase
MAGAALKSFDLIKPPYNRRTLDLEAKTSRRLALELVAASFVVLFQELTLIRWLPGQIRVLAYFPNLILLSAFLGLGTGCLRAGRSPLLWAWLPAVVAVAAAALALSGIVFAQDSAAEHLYLLYYDLPPGAPVVHDVRLPIVVFFLLSVLSFVPLGQLVAQRLEEFRRRSLALPGYGWDILGSLAGVVAFTALGFARTFPVAWFAVFLAAGFVFFADGRRSRLAYLAGAALVVFIVAGAERAERYSPYYALRAVNHRDDPGFDLLANGSLHQSALPLRRSDRVSEATAHTRKGYHLPYGLLKAAPRRALVVGAGTGNDVAVLLDEGAERIDAVEIDPVILELGRERHPDRPYASPRVRAFNTDARSFLNDSREQYDLIVFGTLDSMTRLSALSNVRLDNFMYTVECFRRARERLAPEGGIVVYFMVATDYIALRLGGMLTEAFAEAPLVEEDRSYGLFNRIYMAGPAFAHHGGAERRANAASIGARVRSRTELPRDDWPYLYLARPGINGFYVTLMAIFGGVAVLAVAAASPEMRGSLRRVTGIDVEMFLFGLAFLLLETRSVTEMTLVWGATWLTSAVVFGSILAMILLATLVTQRRPLSYAASMAGLVVSLLVVYALPTRLLLVPDLALRLAASVLFVGAPIFFAASCFALVFRSRPRAAVAFGWNLLGAVAGGLLEFVSMALGLKALLLVALAAYLAAALFHRRRAATEDRDSSTTAVTPA